MNNKEGIFNKTEPFRKISPSVLFTNIRKYNYTFNMNQEKKCHRCEETKPSTEYHPSSSVCKTCQVKQRKIYDTQGINADLSELSNATALDIQGAIDLLRKMGYDVKQDIHTQFKNRIKVLYGVDVENPPKREKRVFKRFY